MYICRWCHFDDKSLMVPFKFFWCMLLMILVWYSVTDGGHFYNMLPWEGGGWAERGAGILESGCPSICRTFVQKIFSEPPQPNLVWWCIIISWSVMQKGWVPIFKVKVTLRSNPQNFTVSLISWILLTFCNQIWYNGASSRAGVLCNNIGLLSSRSRWQWRFKLAEAGGF